MAFLRGRGLERVIRAVYWALERSAWERFHGSLSHVFHQIQVTCNSI